jgi:carotenoid 1,2-hydratase
VGSVFSPYYAWALGRDPATAAEDHCAINVCLYGPSARRWTMTERGRRQVQRSAREFRVGPSGVRWDGTALTIDLDEIGMPLPQRVRGRLRVFPRALTDFTTPLDQGGRHRWGPIAPCSRIEVELEDPALRWSGEAYVDSNEGDVLIDHDFVSWDWSRATLRDGGSAVLYDLRPSSGQPHVVARRFHADGRHEAFDVPPAQALARTPLWRVARSMRSEGAASVRVRQGLEDTPFYSRSLLEAQLCGEPVTAVHESLDVPRLVSLPVRLMLPWRMPRRAG